jgi:protein-arginine kinase activator protein McsA
MEICPWSESPCPHPKKIEMQMMTAEGIKIVNVCEACAQNKLKSISPPNLSSMLQMIDDVFQKYLVAKCDCCGMTQEEIVAKSRFGCPRCYTFFKMLSLRMFERCQESSVHIGKRPLHDVGDTKDKESRIAMLREKIDKAISVENYEAAAVLRDKVQQLMKQKDKNEI